MPESQPAKVDEAAQVASRPKKPKRRKPISAGAETAIWDGLVKVPDRLESSIPESLLYPLRGATGIALLVFLPPLLWFAAIPFVTATVAFSAGAQESFGFGLMFLLLPAGMGFGLVLGYALLFLGRVAASSAVGERHHPRWPDWELSGILHGLGRWLWAAFVGVIVGGFPATAYWVYCGNVDLFDMMILGELLALGAAYGLMALLASILHEDMLAANPVTVFVAIWRVGWGYLQPCLLAGFAVMVAGTLLAASLTVPNGPASAFLFWAFWVVSLYEAMVVLRVLGLLYHKHARELGWFRDRTGWGV